MNEKLNSNSTSPEERREQTLMQEAAEVDHVELKMTSASAAEQSVIREDPLIGTIVGNHLKILEYLGAGGMSVVYKAVDVLLNRTVALKMLHAHHSMDPQNVLRFQREATAASQINHPNVIKVFEFNIQDHSQPYLVLEFIEGTTMSAFIEKNGPIEMRRAISLMSSICDGLQCAHDAGVVHRDLKPGNIMLVKDSAGKQTIKIVDFGIAKLLVEGASGHNLTQTGEVFGSPLYMSPEQCYGKAVDWRSDLYSLGCVMYEMCTGYPPIKGESLLETIQRQVTDMPAPSASICPGIRYGAQFDAVIEKAMAKDPQERYQSATEFKTALSKIIGSPEPAVKRRHRFSRRTWTISIVVLMLMVMALIAKSAFAPHTRSSSQLSDSPSVEPSSRSASVPSSSHSPSLHPLSHAATDKYVRCATDEAFARVCTLPFESQPSRIDASDSHVSDIGIKKMSNNERVRILRAPNSQITDAAGVYIGSAPNLQRLDVSSTNVGDTFLQSISSLKHLYYLWCEHAHITGDGMMYVSKLPLDGLNVSDNPIGDRGLEHLATLRSLRDLRITNTGVTSSGMSNLKNLTHLETLFIGKNNIGNDGASQIAQLPNIRYLGLESTGITDEALQSLGNLSNLQSLNISNNNISIAGLNHLSNLPTLHAVHISNTNIAKDALTQFQKDHPNIRINQK